MYYVLQKKKEPAFAGIVSTTKVPVYHSYTYSYVVHLTNLTWDAY
jgi:hypothetical protein